MPMYLCREGPVPGVRGLPPEDGRGHLGVGAAGVVGGLLARGGEGAVESQGAVRG